MTQGAAEDLWHLSIDDLFVTPVETPPLEGPGPFVINLSASTAPISIPSAGLAGFEKFKLYQLSRKEDGRDRFRLRLGFFDTPAAANEALAQLRDRYPSAFASNATDEDHRFNPARTRSAPGAEAAAAPLPQAAPTAPHARGVVRTDHRRGHKKRDIRRDHSHSRAEGHGPQQGSHGHKQVGRHGTNNRQAPHVDAKSPAEELDVESILLAALAPAPARKAEPRQAPKAEPQHAPKVSGHAKHHRKHPKNESKHVVAKPVAKSSAPAAPSTPAGASKPAVVPKPTPANVPSEGKPAVASAPAVAAVSSTAPVPVTPSAPSVTPARVSPPTLSALAPGNVVATTITYSIALVPTGKPQAPVAEPVKPRPAPQVAKSVPAPEPVKPALAVEVVAEPTTAKVDEAHIATHPRIDAVPAAQAPEASDIVDNPGSDIPIDLHFIDRIFENDAPSDDDVPTVEVLALSSPDVAQAADAGQSPEPAKSPEVAKPAEVVRSPAVSKSTALARSIEAPKSTAPESTDTAMSAHAPPDPAAAKVEAPKSRLIDAAWDKFVDGPREEPRPSLQPKLDDAPKSKPVPVEAKVAEPPTQPQVASEHRPREPEAPAISAHDIIALLTQPLPVARPVTTRVKAQLHAKRERLHSKAQTQVKVQAPVAAPVAKTQPSPQPAAPAIADDGRALARPASIDQAAKIEQTTKIEAPAEIEQPGKVETPAKAEAAAKVETPAKVEQPAQVETELSVAAVSARIESDLDALMASPAAAKTETRQERAAQEPPVDARQPRATVELELEPEAPVPVLKDIIEEVTVAEVIVPRQPPAAPKPTALASKAAPAITTPPPAPAAVSPAREPGTARPSSDSIFKVKSRPVEPAKPAAPAAPEVKRPVVIFDAPIEDVDSTQTLRALTPLELSDDAQSKWFAVQLALSEEPVRVESIPHIDIFDEYRLYSISGIDNARFMHSLRLGFFSAEGSAAAVAGYLRAFFDGASVKRVSIAEHERFAERKSKAEKTAEPEKQPAQREAASGSKSAAVKDKPAGNGSTGDAREPVRKRNSGDSAPTGRHKTLGEQLYEEARQVALSQSAIRRLPKNSSLWSRLFGQNNKS